MKKRVGWTMILVIAVTFALCACQTQQTAESTPVPATTATTTTPAAPATSVTLANLKNISVVFREFKVAQGVVNGDMALVECKASAKSYLQTKSLFKLVEEDNTKTYDPPVLRVDVQLTALRIVSSGARFWGGAFAGRSHMKLLTTIYNAEGTQLAQKELVGTPNAFSGAWSAGATDRSLPQNMGKLLGDYIIEEASKIK